MATKLSYTKVSCYNSCGYKYYLRYENGWQTNRVSSSLVFGTAVDGALNKLLITKDFEQSVVEFGAVWASQKIFGRNTEPVDLPFCKNISYSEHDYDPELLTSEDLAGLEVYSFDMGEVRLKIKETGWESLSDDEMEFHNHSCWLSLYRKGIIMLHAYNEIVLPKIKKVLAVQFEKLVVNEAGDTLTQYPDAIVEWEDGRVILFDHKTSRVKYDDGAAAKSPQLISYYYFSKEEFNITAVGFIVLSKTITKNKIKICSVCGTDGSGSRHSTCFAMNPEYGERCNGAWNVEVFPTCQIQEIIDVPNDAATDLVLDSFGLANDGIKSKSFHKNLNSCVSNFGPCEFYDHCWNKNDSNVIKPID